MLALKTFQRIISTSSRSSSTALLPYDPFLLKEDMSSKPTLFEATFIYNNNKYRYGFSYLENRIVEEWLYRKKVGREVSLFVREEDAIDVSSGFAGAPKLIEAAIEGTRSNALYLSMCDSLNIEEAKDIFQWFKKLSVVDGIANDGGTTTIDLWEKSEYQEKIKNYLTSLQLGFVDIEIAYSSVSNININNIAPGKQHIFRQNSKIGGLQQVTILSVHNTYTKEGIKSDNAISWDFNDKESAGTKKIFELSGPILWTLSNGGVLVIDEIEAKMHPILTLDTIRIFFDRKLNPNNAQLIFATHDTNLLSYLNLRRDQIYFSEKNLWESTEIYSLSDFKYMNSLTPERADSDKERRYLEGRYGAIPCLNKIKIYNEEESYGKESES